ncbi:hypothetical protein BXZ70DRAFT_1060467 [Cristinia sonorae]|uniref:LysM domain-containing protein n=1 Tax=Cristinia sonorae TaxID=1940300 RepID=A0A8K0UZI2_9AGAR|nr:hypothetical protein BXZ70DRAFT_1060467 [Cristinia sonorae]
MPSGNGDTRSQWTEDDDISSLHYNPFAGHSEATFTSAIRPSETRAVTRPAIRRRVSDTTGKRARNDHDPWEEDEDRGGSHSRSRTEFAIGSSRTNYHPLARHLRGSQSNGSIASSNDTRPRLKRLVKEAGGDLSSATEDSHSDTEQAAASVSPTQRVVIVHEVRTCATAYNVGFTGIKLQVSPSDSLAGVALKYGVSLAELRKANQMWTSDTIHLRKELYIPLDKTQKSKQLSLALVDSRVGSSLPTPEREPMSDSSDSPRDDTADLGQHKLTIKRIPASQLSYFPPPSRTSALDGPSIQTMPRSHSDHPPRPALSPDLFSSNFTSPHPQHLANHTGVPIQISSAIQPLRSQFTSLFNALPIAPSTRDTLMARLSFESGASTPTQASEEQELEMGDVSGTSLQSTHSHDSAASQRLVFPEPPLHDAGESAAIGVLDKGLELRPIARPTTPTSRRRRVSSSHTHTTTPLNRGTVTAPYASPERNIETPDVVRTAQLQPSVGMQLPLKARRSKDGDP